MINIKKKYWFYIDSYVHVSLKKNSVLLYNSYNGEILQSTAAEILKLMRCIQAPANLRVIPITSETLKQPIIKNFLDNVRRYFMGDLLDNNSSDGKPMQMPPIVKVQKDVKYLKAEKARSVGEDMISYLSEVSLYVNNTCPQNCPECLVAYKQFLCCTASAGAPKNKKPRNLPIAAVKDFFHQIKGASLSRLNIMGGDVFSYPHLEQLLDIFRSLEIPEKTIYIHYRNLIQAPLSLLERLSAAGAQLRIPVTFPIHHESLELAIRIAPGKFIFVIQDEEQFNRAEKLTETLQMDEPRFQPLYNGNNLELFRDNIFIEQQDIIDTRPTMRALYSRQAVNPLDFGRLSILSDGSIYANTNAPRLGHLGKDSIYDILFKEMDGGKSWRRLRTRVNPCKSCNYELLCPPLSNYNHAIGKNNLCHIVS